MAISVTCECGKTYRVADDWAGRKAKCKACGQTIAIEAVAASSPLNGLLGDVPADASEPRIHVSRKPKVSKRPQKKPDRRVLYLVSGASAAVLLLVVVSCLLFWPESQPRDAVLSEIGEGTRGTESDLAASTDATPAVDLPTDDAADGDSPLSEDDPGDSAGGELGSASDREQSAERAVDLDPPRDFPSIPRALTEIPSWLEDEQPLFDYAAFFAGPTPDNNAAKLYLDALFEFHPPPEETLDLVFDQQETQRRTGEVRRRDEQFDTFVQRQGKALQQLAWWSESADEVRRVLEPFQLGIEKIVGAQRLDACVFDTELTFLPTPHLPNAVIRAGEVLTFRALVAIGQRNIEDTMESLGMLLRLVRDVRRRGQPTMQRVAYQLEEKCFRSIVPPLLVLPGFQPETYDRVLDLISEHERESADGFAEGFRAEYLTARKALHDFRFRVGQFQPDYMMRRLNTDLPVENAAACLNYLLSSRHFRTSVAFEQWEWDELDGIGRGRKFDEFDATANALTEDDYLAERVALDRCYGAILERGERSRVEHYAALGKAVEDLKGTTVAMFLEPDIGDLPLRDLHSRALISGSKCLTAVYRWYAAERRHPDDWEQALSAAGIDAVPDDPFTDGATLKFLRTDNLSVVYSVGPDRTDDKGDSNWSGDPQRPTGDITFRCQVQRAPGTD